MKFLVISDIHDNWKHLREMQQLAKSLDGVIFLGDLSLHKGISLNAFENLSRIYEATNWMIALPGNSANPEELEYLDTLGINLHGTSTHLDDIGFFGIGGGSDPVELVLDLRRYFIEKSPTPIELDPKSIETLNVFGIDIRNGRFEVERWTVEQVQDLEKYRGPFDHCENEIFDILSAGYRGIAQLPYHILLSHIPPYEPGLNALLPEGVSTGSKSIRRFIETHAISYSLSGHYHRHHEFLIDSVRCTNCPAVLDGFYSIFSISASIDEAYVEVKKF